MNNWLAEDALNAAYYSQLKAVWEKSQVLAAASTVNEQQAWEQFRKRAQEIAPPATTSKTNNNWWKIAAAFIVLLGLGWMFFLWKGNNQPVQNIQVASGNAIKNDTLPDGSVVVLNKTSVLQYPEKFAKTNRKVSLTGEAFFQVTPNRKQPFIIEVNDIQVTVLGTSFNIKTQKNKTEVLVETGTVQVTQKGKTQILHAGEKLVTVADSALGPVQPVNNRLYKYYRTREFACEDTPLWQLADALSEAYGVRIVIGRKELHNLPITTTFVNESLDRVLQVIHLTFDIKITRTADSIILE